MAPFELLPKEIIADALAATSGLFHAKQIVVEPEASVRSCRGSRSIATG